MRKVKLLGFAVIAVAAFSAVAVTSALAAAPEWLSKGAAITTPVVTSLNGTLKLEDLKAGVGVQCHGVGVGTVGPGSTDVTEHLKAENCTVISGTCPTPSAEPVKLPWTTELKTTTAVGTGVEDALLSESGYAVTCAGIVKDTCTSAAEIPTVLVKTATPIVEEEFPEEDNKNIGTCSLGGKEGDVAGSFTLEGTTGSGGVTVEI